MSQTTRSPVRPWSAEHVAQREGAVVVLDHEPFAGALGERARSPRSKRSSAAPEPARRAADVEDADRLGPEAHRVEQRGLHLDVAAAAAGRRGSSELRTMYWLGCVRAARRPPAPRADRGERLRALLDLAWNCGRSGCVA